MTGTIKSPQALIFFIPPFSKFETESCPTPPEKGGPDTVRGLSVILFEINFEQIEGPI